RFETQFTWTQASRGAASKKFHDRETKILGARFRNSYARVHFFLTNLKTFNYLRAEYTSPADGRKSKISGSIQKSGRLLREAFLWLNSPVAGLEAEALNYFALLQPDKSAACHDCPQ